MLRVVSLFGRVRPCHGGYAPLIARSTVSAENRDAKVIPVEQVNSLAREVDTHSCHKGQLVHLPAAKARAEYR